MKTITIDWIEYELVPKIPTVWALKQELTQVFNKFVGKSSTAVSIKWDKFLKAFIDWDIYYSDKLKDNYSYPLSWEETTLDKLEKGDVFILVKNCEDLNDIEKEYFHIFMWKENYWDYRIQYLSNDGWVEYIDNSFYRWDDTKIYKFNRV